MQVTNLVCEVTQFVTASVITRFGSSTVSITQQVQATIAAAYTTRAAPTSSMPATNGVTTPAILEQVLITPNPVTLTLWSSRRDKREEGRGERGEKRGKRC